MPVRSRPHVPRLRPWARLNVTLLRSSGACPRCLGIVVYAGYSRWAQSESFEGPGGVPGVVPAGGCDAGMPGHFQDPDGEVAQGGHDLGSVAGADLRGVFAVADIADVVQRLDLPVTADPGGEPGRGCLAGVQADDGVDGDGPPPPAIQRPDLAGEAEGLGGVREGKAGSDGGGLESAVLLAAVAPVVLAGGNRDTPPGQVLDLRMQARLVLAHDQDVVRLLLGDQELRVLALGVQRVGGDDAGGQVTGPGSGGNRVISLVLPSTLSWPSTAPAR